MVNVKVTQRERGESRRGKNNIRGNGAGVVETTFRALRVYDRETSRRGVKETVRGEEVQSHDITPSEKTGQEGNSSQKSIKNVKGNARLAAVTGGGGNNRKQIKRGKFSPVDWGVLQGDNGRRVGQLRERPKE